MKYDNMAGDVIHYSFCWNNYPQMMSVLEKITLHELSSDSMKFNVIGNV
jgi:hypothetical protein